MKLYDANESQKINSIYNSIIYLLREQREIINKLTDNQIFINDLKELLKQQLLDIGQYFSFLDQSRYKKATQRCQIKLQKVENRIHIIYNLEFLLFLMGKYDKYQLNTQVSDYYQDKLTKFIKSQNIYFKYEHKIDEKDLCFIQFLSKLQDNLLLDEIEQLAYLIDIKDEQVTGDQFAIMVDNIQQEREIQMNQLETKILLKLFEDDKINLIISNQKFELMDPNIQKFIIDSKQIKQMKKYTIDKKINEKIQEKILEQKIVLKDNEYGRIVINMSNKQEKCFFIVINFFVAQKQQFIMQLLQQSKQTSSKEIIIHPKLIQDQSNSVIYQLAKEMHRNRNNLLYDIENFCALMEGYKQRRSEKQQQKQALKQSWIGQAQYTDDYFKNWSIYQESLQQDQLYFNQKNKISDYQDGIYIDENQNAVIVKQNNKAIYLGNKSCSNQFQYIQQNIPYMSKDLFRFFIYVILTKTQDYNILYKFLNCDNETIKELIQKAEQDR